MANWSRHAITDAGRELLTNAQAQGKVVTFTKLKTSSHDYSSIDLTQLTTLEDVKQDVAISEIAQEEQTKVKLVTNLTNKSVTTSYVWRTYGLFAHSDGGEDILFSVATDLDPEIVPSISQSPWQSIVNNLISVENIESITININLAANATQQYVFDRTGVYLVVATDAERPAPVAALNNYKIRVADSNTIQKCQLSSDGINYEWKDVGSGGNKIVYSDISISIAVTKNTTTFFKDKDTKKYNTVNNATWYKLMDTANGALKWAQRVHIEDFEGTLKHFTVNGLSTDRNGQNLTTMSQYYEILSSIYRTEYDESKNDLIFYMCDVLTTTGFPGTIIALPLSITLEVEVEG